MPWPTINRPRFYEAARNSRGLADGHFSLTLTTGRTGGAAGGAARDPRPSRGPAFLGRCERFLVAIRFRVLCVADLKSAISVEGQREDFTANIFF